MSIADQITRLSNAKAAIKTSIENKGVSVSDDVKLDGYPALIDKISVGEGEGSTYESPDFYEVRTKGGTSYKGLFCHYLSGGKTLNLSSFDTSKVTDMSYMFSYCYATISGIENWDTSKVTDTSYMFEYFDNDEKYLDLSVLDFSNVSNVERMFYYSDTDCLDVRNINLTGVTSYENLFNNCFGTELDLSAWDISGVTKLSCTFKSTDYNKINLTGWNTVNVTDMSYLFQYARSLTTLLIPDWDMTNTTSTSNMFNNTKVLKYIDASRCNATTMTKLASLILARTSADPGEMIVPADLAQETIDALIAKYWKPIGPKLDLVSTELALELDEIKPGKATKVWTGNNDPWYGTDGLEYIEFISSDESVATVNGREITGIAEGTTDITAVRREDGATVSTTPITLTVAEGDSNPNLIKFRVNGSEETSDTLLTVNDTNLTKSKLTYDSITKVYSYDPGTQITSIKFCNALTSYINEIIKFNFNATNITNVNYMFSFYSGTTLDLSDWDTSGITNMNSMFVKCPNLQIINGEIDMSNCYTNATYRFDSNFIVCPNLETLYLKNIYKNSTMTNSNSWSINLGNTKVKDSCLLYIINELPNLYDKGITNNTEIVFTLPPTNTLTESDVAIAVSKGWICANCNF